MLSQRWQGTAIAVRDQVARAPETITLVQCGNRFAECDIAYFGSCKLLDSNLHGCCRFLTFNVSDSIVDCDDLHFHSVGILVSLRIPVVLSCEWVDFWCGRVHAF